MRRKKEIVVQDLSLAATAAKLSYMGGKTQEEIAEEMGISQSEVSRYIRMAERQRIVRFEIDPLFTVDLRQKLIERFPHLNDVVIVPVAGAPLRSGSLLLRELGLAAARYFCDIVGHHSSIGVSCGNTLNAVIQAMGALKEQGVDPPVACRVFTLNILTTPEVVAITPPALVADLVNHLPDSEGKAFQLPSRVLIGKKMVNAAEFFATQPEVQGLFSEIKTLQYYLIGIGHIDYSGKMHPFRRGEDRPTHEFNSYIRKTNLVGILKDHGAKGESLDQPFDGRGIPIIDKLKDDLKKDKSKEKELDLLRNAVLSLPLDVLRAHVEKNTAVVIAVAGGTIKHEAIRASLYAKIFNVLITDSLTVENILKAEGISFVLSDQRSLGSASE